MDDSPVSVYVRVRPFTPAEQAKGLQPLDGLALETSALEDARAAVVLASGRADMSGFTGLLGQEADTAAVFERCLAQRIGMVLGGGAVSLFCYGYTGGGKTHTVLGNAGERGMYYLAAERLLRDLYGLQPSSTPKELRLFLHATACEIYNDTVYDLLGEEKVECTLRVDESGTLRVLGPAVCEHDSEQDATQVDSLLEQMTEEQRAELHSARDRMDALGIPSVWDGSLHSTDVTRSDGLRSVSVCRPEDLDEIARTSVTQRAVGTSTVHAQSSRSHAIMRLEVVNAAVLTARAALNVATSLLPARKNALDNLTNIAGKLLFLPGQQPMLRVVPRGKGEDIKSDAAHAIQLLVERGSEDLIWNPQICEGWAADGWPAKNESGAVVWKLLDFPEDAPKTCAAWAAQLGVAELRYERTTVKRVFPDGGSLWQSTHASLCVQRRKLQHLLADAQAGVEAARAALAAASDGAGMAPLGGELVLVDLAGADYDHRSGAAQKESAAINISLLALKECFRSIANVSGSRPKFRDSKLTRMLEDALQAPTAGKSRKRSTTAARASVMLVNVSPAAELQKGTINALRYGQLYAGARGGGGGSSSSRQARSMLGNSVDGRAPRAAGGSKPWLTAAAAKPCSPAIVAALRAIYAEHVPDKTSEDVEAILTKFAGREEMLLGKVRAKYVPHDIST